jgi:hypothetical protein
MNWYKYTIKLRGTDDVGYVDLDYSGCNDVDEYLEDLRHSKYPHVEYFRADYDKIDLPPKEYVVKLIESLEAPELWKAVRASELREAIGMPRRNMEQMSL